MSDSTNLNVRIDKELKLQADSLFSELGMNLTTAITVFIRQTVREKKIPFEITLETNDSAKVAAAIRGRDALR
ncbi:MAG: type II toxin-antitoxin system RelB/DinJ family antitoxin, partial [Oscillospiraceae bacterium]|nr:type II toxin-antitoxin system RelB/DinJ family antitoxin [Oscillospiraceae bacterium]